MADPGEPIVSVSGVGKRYGEFWASREVSFDVRPGEIFGIIGPNGAGKTTTLKLLAGLLRPTEGRARIAGLDVTDPDLKRRIGYLPEESPLYEDMTPLAYLRFFADLYAIPRLEAEERVERILDNLKLEVRTERKIGDLSKGQRRKVAIARSLVNDPEVLLFDEPASGLDPVVSAYVLQLIGDLRKAGKTVLFSAHNLYHVERICDRITILLRGRQAVTGTMKEIRAQVGGVDYRVRLSVPVEGARPVEDGFEIPVPDFAAVSALERKAKDLGGRVLEVRTVDLPLEEIFLRTTKAG